ncbi:MAG TPA: SRPBCC domain-containing protein [Telluria sp.]|jgi:uncharacterized protein YndB with AHSA1/START domain
MNHFQKSVTMAARPEAVYAALTTIAGLRNWWTQDCDGSTAVGGTIHFRFGACYNDMRVEAAQAAREVRWHCTRAHTIGETITRPDEWVGTEPVFHLHDAGQAGTRVDFEHRGLLPSLECYGICENGWAHFLGSLQQYLETGEGTPYTGAPAAPSHTLEKRAAA